MQLAQNLIASDSRTELAVKKNVFTETLVRRVVHVVVGRGVMKELGGCLVVMEDIFK